MFVYARSVYYICVLFGRGGDDEVDCTGRAIKRPITHNRVNLLTRPDPRCWNNLSILPMRFKMEKSLFCLR